MPEKDREEIGAEISRIPGGWLKKFCDDGWKFIYCPDTEEFLSAKGDNGGRYQVNINWILTDRLCDFPTGIPF